MLPNITTLVKADKKPVTKRQMNTAAMFGVAATEMQNRLVHI